METKVEERILDKLDKINDQINAIDVTLARNTTSLELHMKRSDHLEKMINKVETDLKPVENHVALINGIFKAVGAVGVVVGLIIAAIKLVI